jgi:hypothetical protein
MAGGDEESEMAGESGSGTACGESDGEYDGASSILAVGVVRKFN